MKRLLSAVAVLLIAAAPLPARPDGAEWPQWRGPKRDGVSSDTGLLKEWPKEGPPLLWEAKGAGRGYSSVAISSGMIYTIGDGPSTAEDKDEYLLAFELAGGKQAWKSKLGAAYTKHGTRNDNWNSSRSTPTVDRELVYVMTAAGDLICLSSTDGKVAWRKNMQSDFGGNKGDGWGYSESPLVDGDNLLCCPGGKSGMVCLNKRSGTTLWSVSAPGNPGAGHSSIVISEIGKIRAYVVSTSGGVLAVDAADGKLLWYHPFQTPKPITAVIPTPVVKDEFVFVTAAYGFGALLLKQTPTEGGVKVEQVYGVSKDLQNKHGGVVLVGDYLYGDFDDKANPWCAELKSGSIKWKERGSGSGSTSITAADGYLYLHFANGQMALAKASPDGYKEVGSFKIPHNSGRPSWSHPVVAGQKLFIREGDYLLCYDLKAK